MSLNIHADESNERQRLATEVLNELTTWQPRDRMQAFRTWLAGSLSLVHLHVLTILEAGGPQSMSRLADALDVSLASATGIVDRMEHRLLVARKPDPDDRRMVVVHMLEPGADIFRHLAEHRRQSLSRILDRLTGEELGALLIGLRALRAARELDAADAADADTGGRAARTGTHVAGRPRAATGGGAPVSTVAPATLAAEPTAP